VAPRQPGSALKPFTYALAFDPTQKKPWTPATMILDVSTPFVTRRLESYTPANYGLVEHGPVLIREALASSYNIPAVITLDHVGVDSLVSLLHRLGITTLQNPDQIGLSVTLGGGEVRLNELTAAYAAFATGGRPIQTSLILEVKDKHGTVLYRWQPPAQQAIVIDPRVVWLISDILSDNNARIPAFGTHSPLAIGRPAAVKTGTTTDFRDNWTVGYTPQVVVGVWVGNANNTPMVDVSGVSGAGPIWNEFMRTALQDKPELDFERPSGLVQAEVCATSGLLPTPYCPKTRLDWFIESTVPTTTDDMYQPFTIDRRTGLLATDQTPLEDKVQQVFMVLPQEARTWGLRHGVKPLPVSPEQVARKDDVLRLLSPDPYTVFQLSPVLPFDAQRVRFAVGVAPGTTRVEYWLNGKLFEAVQSDPWLAWWPLTPGQYILQAKATLRDGSTQASDPIRFTVASFVPPEERPSSGEVH
jgi:membrane carboxypeptidase/penicillin-binding protein PbpC